LNLGKKAVAKKAINKIKARGKKVLKGVTTYRASEKH